MGIGAFITCIYILKRSKFDLKIFFALICFFMFSFTVLFSYSRTVWGALVFCILLYVFFQSKYLKVTNIIYILVFSIIVIFLLINVDSLSNRLAALTSLNLSGRDLMWMKAIDLIKEHPLFGWGLDTWKINGTINYAGIHNSILEVMLFTGFFGLLAFISLLYMVLKTIIVNKQWELLCIVFFLIITSQFGHSVFKSKIFLSVTTIVLFYVYCNRIENKNEKL